MSIRRASLAVGLLLATSLAAQNAAAQLAIQASQLNPSGNDSAIDTGYSTRMSTSGNALILGAPNVGLGVGAAFIYARSGGTWAQQGNKLAGTGSVGFSVQGWATAMSGDGNTVAVGGPGDNSNVGAVWVYALTNGAWAQQGTKLLGSGGVGASQQGYAVALSADGNTLAVGAPYDNSSVGAVWIFTRSGTAWSQQGAKLVGTGFTGAADIGYSVALSADGNTLLVGAPTDNGGNGALWVFTRSGSTWSQQGSKQVAGGSTGPAQLGISVSLSADGATAAAGGNWDNSQTGATWIYTRSGSTWSQQGGKLVGTGGITPSWQGLGVSLSGDGETLAVGAMEDHGTIGALWMFTRAGATWTQLGSKVAGPGASEFGKSLSLSSDGNTLAVGMDMFNYIGDVRVFVRPAPAIVSIQDVPNDQGGLVNLRWNASVLDYMPTDPVNAYGIWRQVPSGTAARMLSLGARRLYNGSGAPSPGDLAVRSVNEAGATYYWEYLGNQPARGYAGYSYTAPTTSDSLPGSNPYTLFLVETQQSSLGVYWPSLPDSGYSVDNLAPAAPAAFAGSYAAGATQMSWWANAETDLGSYRLYRGTLLDFTISPDKLAATLPPNATSYVDAPGAAYIYKLTAVDVHGNESAPATLLPGNVTAVEGSLKPELALVLPTPVSSAVTAMMRYSLPRDESVSLTVYDVGGRLVRSLVDGPEARGSHTLAWDRKDGVGRTIASGIYFVRLVASEQTLVRRVVMVR